MVGLLLMELILRIKKALLNKNEKRANYKLDTLYQLITYSEFKNKIKWKKLYK